MRLSDIIAAFIAEALEDTDGSVELSRAELAERFGCVPSQINYVISTRFTPEHGYLVRTKRGGGGYLRISRVQMTKPALLMHVVNAIGPELDAACAAAYVQNLGQVIDEEARYMLYAATSDAALQMLPQPLRDITRASIMKQCLVQLASL